MGTGYCILIKDQVVVEETIPLETYPAVFQAKVMAIFVATKKLLDFAVHWKIVIHSDSQAALHVLKNPVVMSQMILANALAEKQVVSLWWVKAHIGVYGNEKAGSSKESVTNDTNYTRVTASGAYMPTYLRHQIRN
jgi:hypothetical protein